MSGDGRDAGEGADAALQRAIADACLGERAGERATADLRAFLESHGVASADVERVRPSAKIGSATKACFIINLRPSAREASRRR